VKFAGFAFYSSLLDLSVILVDLINWLFNQ